jgi:perosamine synthetase
MTCFAQQPTASAEPTSELRAVLAATRQMTDDGVSWPDRFERDLAHIHNIGAAVVVSSDSAAMTVLLGTLDIPRGAEVAVARGACPAWALGALALAGVNVVEDGGPQCSLAFGPPGYPFQTASPCAVDLSGLALDQWLHAMGTAPIGLAPLSHGQPLSTGEGGILLFADARLGAVARRFARFGELNGLHPGGNYKLSAPQAALGLHRLHCLMKTGRAPVHVAPKPLPSQTVPDRFDPTSPADAEMIARALARDLSGAGETVLVYEAALSHWYDATEAIAVSSGFAAVLTALQALGLRAGDEVLLTPTCPLCTVYALTAIGVVPVFCDTQPDGFSICLGAAEAALGPRTRVIIDIPMWGYPVHAPEVAGFARHHGLAYMLDLALGHGTMLGEDHIWRHADIATFSTHASKVLVTGEGGFVLTNRADLAERLRLARFQGGGGNFRLAGLQAALGLARLPHLANQIARRRAVMASISAGLDHPEIEAFPLPPRGIPTGVKMLVRHRNGAGAALNRQLDQHGVPSDILIYNCRPLYDFPILAERQATCPNAVQILQSIATLPVHPDISPAHVERMLDALNSLPQGLRA